MIWIIAYRRDGEGMGRCAARGRAAAILAAIDMIDRGIEVLSVRNRSKTKSVSADDVQRVRDLQHAPFEWPVDKPETVQSARALRTRPGVALTVPASRPTSTSPSAP
ncbi:MAG: hypothetical protein ACREFI_16130 [Stellaceae bacterium]